MLKITPNLPPYGPLVVALVYDGLCTFEFAIAVEIFGLARPEMGDKWYRFAACGVEPGPLCARGGLNVEVDGGMELLDQADIIIVPGWKGAGISIAPELIAALRTSHGRGARLVSICSGSFVLAATGLLDGRRAATHWRYAEALQAAFPAIEVDASVLYIDEGQVLTSAGSAAGIDLMLHIVRGEFGADAANSVARRLVVSPHRNGGQAQFVERPVPTTPRSGLAPLLDLIRAEPGRRWSVTQMAGIAKMSERSFLRRFAEATGTSPGNWIITVRVDEAKRLLETTDASVEQLAMAAGFGSPATLRHHFFRATGLSPRRFREAFGRKAT